ncbi:MAG: hypothetical protein K2J77_10300 [Oscillospiraceae bacterium]|nr:hypothetical protein [Oscillospiraceae bacterium]
MKTAFYLLGKYWKKHKKNAAALLFAGVLLTAIIFAALMSSREQCVRYYCEAFDRDGHYDVLIGSSDDEILANVTEGRSGYTYGAMYVLGEMGFAGSRFAYGTIDDAHDLWHVPLDEGRMPETSDEIAAVSTVLDACYWVGKCGDSITLDGRTFTVVGIINEDYGKYRFGSALNPYNIEEINASPCRTPLIFVGESDEAPLFRIDMLGNIFDLRKSREELSPEIDALREYLYETVGYETRWYHVRSDRTDILYSSRFQSPPTRFFIIIAWIGAAISVLSVLSVLRSVFAERRGRIEILKRIGMNKREIGKLYAAECAVFAIIQTALGILVGLAAYCGIFAFKVNALDEKPISGFTSFILVTEKTHGPFLYAGLISIAITVAAYVLNILTANVKRSSPSKARKPRSLARCFIAVFRERAVTIVQTAALTLICFSVLIGYMFYTDNGKEFTNYLTYMPPSVYYNVKNFNMEQDNIAEYYSCPSPDVRYLGHQDFGENQYFPFITADYTAGIDDEIAEKLPEYALATGELRQTFLASGEEKPYINEMELSHPLVRKGFLNFSGEKYQSFFEDGQLGAGHLYQTHTKLAPARTIESLSENLKDGALNIDALNSGEEILVTYKSGTPPFAVGETVTIYSAAAGETGYGIEELVFADVKIGALLQIPQSVGKTKYYTLRNDHEYSFLTTARGAESMGFPCAKYTEIYCSEPIDGGIIPLSAEMKMTSLATLKRGDFVKKMKQYGGAFLILLVMSLLGFSAYFNGIGMKIRQKSYELSITRAVGTPVKALSKKLTLASLKTPLIASTIAYALAKAVQFITRGAYLKLAAMEDEYNELTGKFIAGTLTDDSTRDALLDKMLLLVRNYFLDNVMWQVKTELPALIIFTILCAVTFILTAMALKKFRRSISDNLNSGRTRQ